MQIEIYQSRSDLLSASLGSNIVESPCSSHLPYKAPATFTIVLAIEL